MHKPEGFHTVTPYMVFRDAPAALAFYEKAFGAVLTYRQDGEDGKLRHAQMRIGDSHLMFASEYENFPFMRAVETLGGSPIHLFLYVEDADAFAAHAVEAGCEMFFPLADQEYGRSCGVRDPFGHIWWITTHKEKPAS
jgi:PhnB protein